MHEKRRNQIMTKRQASTDKNAYRFIARCSRVHQPTHPASSAYEAGCDKKHSLLILEKHFRKFRIKKEKGHHTDYQAGILSILVHPWGVEPQSSEPESDILSIELRVHFRFAAQKYNYSFIYPNDSAKKLFEC